MYLNFVNKYNIKLAHQYIKRRIRSSCDLDESCSQLYIINVILDGESLVYMHIRNHTPSPKKETTGSELEG